jgi:hypothetical protein
MTKLDFDVCWIAAVVSALLILFGWIGRKVPTEKDEWYQLPEREKNDDDWL